MKGIAFAQRESRSYQPLVGSLAEIAAKLGGDAEGEDIVYCPAPGQPPDDRSLVIKIDPRAPAHFFIYLNDGGNRAAYAMVREKLGLISEPSPLDNLDRLQAAAKIWESAIPAAGTIVETYLRSRGITLPIPPSLRFAMRCWHAATKQYLPAMVSKRSDADGHFAAIHRTFLRADGMGKADVASVKTDFGSKRGTAIRLADYPGGDVELAIGEGIESTMSYMQLYGLPGWAAGSARDLEQIDLPPHVRRVVIVADGDRVGDRAATATAEILFVRGIKARIARPPAMTDFNDALLNKLAAKKGPQENDNDKPQN
jgi:hypothetical protein